jgi:hypothetical protein
VTAAIWGIAALIRNCRSSCRRTTVTTTTIPVVVPNEVTRMADRSMNCSGLFRSSLDERTVCVKFHFVSYRESNPRGNVLGQRLYNQTAVAWAKFWEENWSRFTSVEAFAKVDVQLVPEGKLPNPVSRVTALVKNSGQGNGSVGSVFSAEGTRCFRDLDTGLVGDLPERFLKLTREQRMARMGEIVA